jgi:hypothetical protein
MKVELKKIGKEAPSQLPIVFNANMDALQSVVDSLIKQFDDVRVSLSNLRKKVIEESSSKVSVDKFQELNNKFLTFNDKLITVKKESLVLRKRINKTKGLDKNSEIVTRKNNDEIECLKEEMESLKDNLKHKIEEVKKLQKDLVSNEVERIVESITPEPVTVEVPKNTSIDEDLLKQIQKQLFKNEEDIEELQNELNSKNKIIEDMREEINKLKKNN